MMAMPVISYYFPSSPKQGGKILSFFVAGKRTLASGAAAKNQQRGFLWPV